MTALGEAKRLGSEDPAVAENLAEAQYRWAVAELAAGRLDSARRSLAEAVAGDPKLAARRGRTRGFGGCWARSSDGVGDEPQVDSQATRSGRSRLNYLRSLIPRVL